MASKIHVTGISSLITLRITTSGIILLVKKDYRNISVIDNFSAREWSGSLRLLQQFINTEQGDARHFLAHRTYMVHDTATTFRLPASSSLQTIQAHTHSNRHSVDSGSPDRHTVSGSSDNKRHSGSSDNRYSGSRFFFSFQVHSDDNNRHSSSKFTATTGIQVEIGVAAET